MDWSTIGMIALMGGAVYFLMIRPQQKKAKETAALMSSLEPGSRVMTISGIVGTIKYLGDKQAILEVSPGVEITMDKRALSTQPVVDEFEYSDDAEPELIAGETVAAITPEITATEGVEPAEAEASDEATDGPTWDAPPTSKN
jgi:preprotein translocase subunit YajC